MDIICSKCSSKFRIPDEKIPAGRLTTLPCPNCKTRISLDPAKKTTAAAARGSARVAAVVAAAGLAIGLAFQESLSNFAAGVLLVRRSPVEAPESEPTGVAAETADPYVLVEHHGEKRFVAVEFESA